LSQRFLLPVQPQVGNGFEPGWDVLLFEGPEMPQARFQEKKRLQNKRDERLSLDLLQLLQTL